MIILDTNVLSELMRPAPSSMVTAWLDKQVPGNLFLTVTVLHELWFGIERLPAGQRRLAYEAAYTDFKAVHFKGRVLAVDVVAAEHAARLRARRLTAGRPIDVGDSFIAGIAMARGFALATRNTRDFDAIDLTLINPFEPIS